MTDLPHPALRSLYRAAAAPQQMMRRLLEPAEWADRFAIDLDALDLCRSDLLASLLAGTEMDARLGAVGPRAPSASRSAPAMPLRRMRVFSPAATGTASADAPEAGSAPDAHDFGEPPASDVSDRRTRTVPAGRQSASRRRFDVPAEARGERQALVAHEGTDRAGRRRRPSQARRERDRAAARLHLEALAARADLGAALSTPLAVTGEDAKPPATAADPRRAAARPEAEPADPVAARLALVLARVPEPLGRRPAWPERRHAEEREPPLDTQDMIRHAAAPARLPPLSIEAEARTPARGLRGLAQLAASFPNATAPSEPAPVARTPDRSGSEPAPPSVPPDRSEDLGRRLAAILQREARRYGIEPEDGA